MTRPLIAALLLSTALGLTACGGKKDEAKPTKAPAAAGAARAVTVGLIESRPLGAGFEASGQLVPREEAAVGSELGGYRVARVLVEEGAFVRAGQPLVQLDDTLLRAQIAQQAAVTAQAQAEAARVAGLDGQGVLSQEQIEARRYAAKAQEAALAELKTRAGRMTITAPVSGRVLERTVRPGEISGGATGPWFRIARDGLVELDAEVGEAQLSGLRPGQSAQVALPDGRVVTGVIRLVSPRIDPATHLGKVRVRLPLDSDLRPGGFGRATFAASSKTVKAVPETAIRYDAEGSSLVTVDSANRARQSAVRTGQRGGGWVEILDGPPVGSRVLLGGSAFTLDGDLVAPTNAAGKAAR
nr:MULTISPECIES: efflux RND transporter periplasmic adaptor subunit [unclassified Caulobacter]